MGRFNWPRAMMARQAAGAQDTAPPGGVTIAAPLRAATAEPYDSPERDGDGLQPLLLLAPAEKGSAEYYE